MVSRAQKNIESSPISANKIKGWKTRFRLVSHHFKPLNKQSYITPKSPLSINLCSSPRTLPPAFKSKVFLHYCSTRMELCKGVLIGEFSSHVILRNQILSESLRPPARVQLTHAETLELCTSRRLRVPAFTPQNGSRIGAVCYKGPIWGIC